MGWKEERENCVRGRKLRSCHYRFSSSHLSLSLSFILYDAENGGFLIKNIFLCSKKRKIFYGFFPSLDIPKN